jgi:hypothetical protein
MPIFTGIFRGGPYDGRRLAHTSKTYTAEYLPPLKPGFTNVPLADCYRYGYYAHVLGQWIWHDDSDQAHQARG